MPCCSVPVPKNNNVGNDHNTMLRRMEIFPCLLYTSGTIEAGKFADMVVIDRDIFNVPEDEIKDIKALHTYMAGNETYCREGEEF